MLNFVWTNHVLMIVLVCISNEQNSLSSLSNSMQFSGYWRFMQIRQRIFNFVQNEMLNLHVSTCKLSISFWTKFWNFWRITRISSISRCKVICAQKSPVFGPPCIGLGPCVTVLRMRRTSRCWIEAHDHVVQRVKSSILWQTSCLISQKEGDHWQNVTAFWTSSKILVAAYDGPFLSGRAHFVMELYVTLWSWLFTLKL